MRGEFINEYQKLNSKDQKTFRRWLWANAIVVAILLTGLIALASKFPGVVASAAERTGTIPVECAARDLQVVTQLEQRGEAQDVASDKLAAAFFTMMRARRACNERRVSEAEAIYGSISLQPTRSAGRP
jgi:Flp pilus assembly protein CpaB